MEVIGNGKRNFIGSVNRDRQDTVRKPFLSCDEEIGCLKIVYLAKVC